MLNGNERKWEGGLALWSLFTPISLGLPSVAVGSRLRGPEMQPYLYLQTPGSSTQRCPSPARGAGQGRRHRLPAWSRWEAPTSAHRHSRHGLSPPGSPGRAVSKSQGNCFLTVPQLCIRPHGKPDVTFFFFFLKTRSQSTNLLWQMHTHTHKRKTYLKRTRGKEMICSLSRKTNTKKIVNEYT